MHHLVCSDILEPGEPRFGIASLTMYDVTQCLHSGRRSWTWLDVTELKRQFTRIFIKKTVFI